MHLRQSQKRATEASRCMAKYCTHNWFNQPDHKEPSDFLVSHARCWFFYSFFINKFFFLTMTWKTKTISQFTIMGFYVFSNILLYWFISFHSKFYILDYVELKRLIPCNFPMVPCAMYCTGHRWSGANFRSTECITNHQTLPLSIIVFFFFKKVAYLTTRQLVAWHNEGKINSIN